MTIPPREVPHAAWKRILREIRTRTAPRTPRAIQVGASMQEIAAGLRMRQTPRFFNEKSCLKLVFATLWQASERWQNVRMSDVECKLLDHLRRELQLDEEDAQPNLTVNRPPVEAIA